MKRRLKQSKWPITLSSEYSLEKRIQELEIVDKQEELKEIEKLNRTQLRDEDLESKI